MRKNGRDNRPYLKPVTRIELSEQNIKLRWILIVVLMLIGIGALAYGFSTAMNTQPGWQQIEAMTEKTNCAADFSLMFEFTESTGDASMLNSRLSRSYGALTEEAYRLFSADVQEEGLRNLRYLNAHVNEAVTLEEPLYEALALAAKYENRHIFLAPAAGQYTSLFLSQSDTEAVTLDPTNNAETLAWFRELSVFVQDPAHIRLELLENNQICLRVSDAYLAFAEENVIETFLDFGWMRNAFIADYLAQSLTAQGYTRGYLTSYDGFTRNLDTREQTYYFNLFNRQGNEILLPARMAYQGPYSIVFLRNYPMTQSDRWHYYTYASGKIVTAFLDPKDCLSKSSTSNLVFTSRTLGCAEILLQSADLFIGDHFPVDALSGLQASGIYTVWFENGIAKHNAPGITVEAVS